MASPLSQVLNSGGANYVYGAERLFASTGGTRTWYGSDALGSVRQTLSDAGAVLGTTSYDPWGVVESGTSAPFGFTDELQGPNPTFVWDNVINDIVYSLPLNIVYSLPLNVTPLPLVQNHRNPANTQCKAIPQPLMNSKDCEIFPKRVFSFRCYSQA